MYDAERDLLGSFFTRHTLVWQGTKFAVFFLCPVTDISATVALIGVKFCTMVHSGPGQIFSLLGGGIPRELPNPNFGHLTADISKTLSRSVTCHVTPET